MIQRQKTSNTSCTISGDRQKYPKPKILLIDTDTEVTQVLHGRGYNALTGTLGTPYLVKSVQGTQQVQHEQLMPVHGEVSLPNFDEQEIVIIDLETCVPEEIAQNAPVIGEPGTWFAMPRNGVIDPRLLTMAMIEHRLRRITDYGGVIVVFADTPRTQVVEMRERGQVQFREEVSSWSFLPEHLQFPVNLDSGHEMMTSESQPSMLGKLLGRHLKDGEFRCTFRWWSPWQSIAVNKYGDAVALLLLPSETSSGCTMILPQIADKPGFLLNLISEVLPDLVPGLFPYATTGQWVHDPEYELPRVILLKNQIKDIESEAVRNVEELRAEINREREISGYLHSLLTATGDSLVRAVKHSLSELGFTRVIDVDEAPRQPDGSSLKREDLQIFDRSPTLLVEVKGLVGKPSQADSLQVGAYIAPRMKQWERTDVQGLEIINHQRRLPALDRDNGGAFEADVVVTAESQGIGLMTTWDLYRLVRGYLQNNWDPEVVQDVLYRSGRLVPVPSHYEHIGEVVKVWKRPEAAGVHLQVGDLHRGERLAFELAVDFHELQAQSLKIEHETVDYAPQGASVGIATGMLTALLRPKMRVFRIKAGAGSNLS